MAAGVWMGRAARAANKADGAYETELWIESRGGAQRVLVRDLDWVEAERDYVRIFAGDASYLLRGSITAIEERLDPEQFLRVHRSTILRRSAIAQVRHRGAGAWVATDMAGGSTNIGRSFLANVRAKLGLSGP